MTIEQNGNATLRILVIDDEEGITALLERVLARWGYVVQIASDGSEAWDLLETEWFDLILSDLRMPDMDGEELLGLLKQRHPQLLSRVVFMSGDTLSDGAAHFLAMHDRPALHKPFDLEHLRETLQETLKGATNAKNDASPPGVPPSPTSP